MRGKLFTGDFLREGIALTPAWQAIDAGRQAEFTSSLKTLFAPFATGAKFDEALTESQLILPVLATLGWQDALPQQSAAKRGRTDVPDILLFESLDEKQHALAEKSADRRYRHGALVAESKKWERQLDRGEDTDALDPGTPSNQILRYLSAVETASDKAIQWGVLTNGRIWRLYWQGAQSRAEDFLEIDLGHALQLPGVQAELPDGIDANHTPQHALKLFMLLFGKSAFQPQAWDNDSRTLLHFALDEGQKWQTKVSGDLGDRVFQHVFPQLANALAKFDPEASKPYSPAYLAELRDATLILLYRLLFVLYAEDRELLPTRDKRYDDYSLTKLRKTIGQRIDANDTVSTRMTRIWDDLSTLFGAISQGDSSLGLPAYNGGLFEADKTSLVRRARVSDALLAPIIDQLSRRGDIGAKQRINYRDLNVQHLGSVYERLLDYLLIEENGEIKAAPQSFARRVTGSYYTHDDLVKLIIRTTIGPLVREKIATFDAECAKLAGKKTLTAIDCDHLARVDPANAILSLKICDPAMGSGHFLVTLVDYLADQALEAIAYASDHADAKQTYRSPVLGHIGDIRERILHSAAEHGWPVLQEQLDDRHLIRRMILKRVIFGADKNPMAVELAKVALWLHTFTVGAPLSFLDHHLRCGDSLHGEKVGTVYDEVRAIAPLLQQSQLTAIEVAAAAMDEISSLTDIDIAEAHRSKQLLDDIDVQLAPLKALLDFWRAMRWMVPGFSAKLFKQKKFAEHPLAEALTELFSSDYELLKVLHTGTVQSNDLFGNMARQVKAQADAQRLIADAKALAAREQFLHWSLAFPTVWASPHEHKRGFDAVIGNPPWDRMKMQEVEWFAERKPEIAKAARAADRKKMIDALKKAKAPMWADYALASETAETASRVVRECGDYPLLSGGDVNLYSLFVERASALIAPAGIVGLLTPSGIAADKGAAAFFKSISQTGRLGALYDFENKKTFFPDIHASFKFSALVFGGEARRFEATSCAFYLHRIDDLRDDNRVLNLTADDFSAVNPNTGGAPIFRTRRDAQITTRIYREFPVLIDHRSGVPKKVWPVRYATMFHMTNDSKLFKRRDELEKSGWYPVAGNRWKKGKSEAVPLYVGRMIHQYDHRASNVTVNEENLHNAALSGAISSTEKAQPDFYPTPQYWVAESDISNVEKRKWALGFRDIARATDTRTMIATVVPTVCAGNKLPFIFADKTAESSYRDFAPLIAANLNSIAFDFVARQKIHSTSMNWFIVEQLPVIPPKNFEHKIGKHVVGDFIRGEVLRLSYTAHDMASFARDQGYDGPPFVWNADDRRHRTARLDALFFHLYGIDRDDAAYILDTFPIVRENDEKAHGHYLTKALVLAYMNAVKAGDLDSIVEVQNA